MTEEAEPWGLATWRLCEGASGRLGEWAICDLARGRLGDVETWRCGDLVTWRLGDFARERGGDFATWRVGDFAKGRIGEINWIQMSERIKTHRELRVYQISFEASMEIFEVTRGFPKQETYSLTDQIRRSSRSVSSNIAEAWRKRKYPKAFVSKLSDSEGEAAETQTWLDYALACKYITQEQFDTLDDKYDHIIGMLENE